MPAGSNRVFTQSTTFWACHISRSLPRLLLCLPAALVWVQDNEAHSNLCVCRLLYWLAETPT